MNKKRKSIFFAIAGFIVIASVITWFLVNNSSISHFDYRGVKFDIENKKGNILYKTSLPVTSTNEKTGKVTSGDYSFYLINDPRKLERINFYGDIVFMKGLVLNITNEFKNCNAGINEVQNLLKLYDLYGTKVIKNETAGCDDLYGTYSWANIRKGNKTEITEWGLKGGCYNIYIHNCELSQGVERFILENLVEINKKIK